MKKNILIITVLIIAISVTAFDFLSEDNNKCEAAESKLAAIDKPGTKNNALSRDFEFIYFVGTRFTRAIKKSDLDQAKSITEFLSEEEVNRIVSYHSVKVTLLDDIHQLFH